ncbi:hypothetical protein [Lysinibacillus sp. NPDC056185]|uniref:hypothetical protein n=1 Tax=Lysinibacillus sp. NPDC056185 TaxID=3345739 RepID=UPI0039EE84F7
MMRKNINIFQLKSKPHGKERLNEFVGTAPDDSFIAIGWPGIGDLTNASKDKIRELLEKVYDYKRQQLATYLGAVNAFVNTVKKGDLVLISNNHDHVYIFEVDDYRYEEKFDNDIDGMCHQRKAELLMIVAKSDLNLEIQELLRNRGTITQFKYPYEKSELDKFIGETDEFKLNLEQLVNKSLNVLEKELDSDDSICRIKAAAEILRYAKDKN